MDAAGTASSTSAQQQDGRSVGGGGVSDYLNLGMFNSTISQHSGELLVGGAAVDFGNALGNGFIGNVDSSISAGVGAVPSTGTSFDLSDFPSLGGTGGGPAAAAAAAAAAAGSGNGLAAALRQQQQLLAHQQMLQGSVAQKGSNMYRLAMTGSNGTFNVTPEDFPALSGGAPQSSGGSIGINGSTLNASALLQGGSSAQSVLSSRAPSNGSAGGLYGGDLEGATNQLDGRAGLLGSSGIGGLEGLGGLQQQLQQPQSSGNPGPILSRAPSSSGPPSAPAVGSATAAGVASGSAAGTALGGDYGLLGLLGVIRMTDADRNALALGSDLTMLGLNLGTVEQLYSTFSGPWSDGLQPKEPHYQLPSCYYMQPPALKTGHLSKFQLETLFYIFYALPKDVLQAYAAQELYSREYRYHGELKLWFKRAGPSDGVAANSTGAPQYLYFDINSWERRLFNGSMNQNITNGFLSEEDVRVKFPSS